MFARCASAFCAAVLIADVARAHTVLDETSAKAGTLHTAKVRVMDGCGASPTVRVRVELPDDVRRVTPRVQPGWTVKIERVALAVPEELHGRPVTERVAAVEWSGGSLQADAFDEFQIRMALPARPGATLLFPVTQTCAEGAAEWRDPPSKSGPPPAFPAPALTLTE